MLKHWFLKARLIKTEAVYHYVTLKFSKLIMFSILPYEHRILQGNLLSQ